jgi:hypothetical protein
MTETQGETVLDPRLNWFIALGNQYNWGRAETEKQAIANMKRAGGSSRKTTEYIVYAATEATYVNDMGGLNRPGTDPEAVKIKHVKPKK